MQLHIKDRIYIPQILPASGTFMEFNLKKSIIGKVGITEKDKEHFNIETNKEAGSITWNSEIDLAEPLEVTFTKEELEFLKKSCEGLSDKPFPDDFWIVVEKIYNSKV